MRNYVLTCAAGGVVPERFRRGNHRFVVFDYANNVRNEGKWKNIYWMLREIQPRPKDFFWFPDPDLEFPDGTIDLLFSIARANSLDLCQPALTLDSKCCHAHLVQRENGNEIRQVPFVEIMCPLFSAPALYRNCWTFNLNYSGYGIDFLWGKKEKCFLINSVTVKHPTAPHYPITAKQWGFPNPDDELAEMQRLFHV